MTTSVSRRWIGPAWRTARPSASSPLPALEGAVAVGLEHLAGEGADRRLVLHHEDRLPAGRRSAAAGARLGAPAPGPSARGSRMRNDEPRPGSLSTAIWPPLCCTMPYTMERPRPVPPLPAFVVKKGSKTWARVFSSMPWPVSRTVSGDLASGSRPAAAGLSRRPSRGRACPRAGIASRAFTARFMSTWSICAGSTRTRPRAGSSRVTTSTSSPRSGRSMRAVSRDERVQVHDLRLHHLLAAEGEELAHEARGPLGGPHDVLHLPQARVVRLEAPAQQLAVAHDDHEQVVEVVGDAARRAGPPPPSSATGGAAPRGGGAPPPPAAAP